MEYVARLIPFAFGSAVCLLVMFVLLGLVLATDDCDGLVTVYDGDSAKSCIDNL